VKGVAFRTVESCFAELRGEAARRRADEHLPPELAEAFRYRTVMATGWYSIDQYKALFRAFRAVTGEGPELAREIGRLAARHDMSGVHKQIVARIISPQALLGMSQRVFSTYYDTGTFAMLESRKGFAHAQATGWLTGSAQSLLEIAGAKHVRTRTVAGGKDGDDFLDFEARWA
jgi:hypothetical protein